MQQFKDSGLVGSCMGCTALVAGNGPSIDNYPAKFYERFPLSVGVNTVAQCFRPSLMYNIERKPFRWGDAVKDPDQLGIPWVTASFNQNQVNADWWVDLDLNAKGVFPMTREAYDNKCAVGYCSPFGALHMAYVLGATRIYLVGIDFCLAPNGKKYAGSRPEQSGDSWYLDSGNNRYVQTLSWFSLAFVALRDAGCEVYDLSRFGQLRDLEKVTESEVVFKGPRMIDKRQSRTPQAPVQAAKAQKIPRQQAQDEKPVQADSGPVGAVSTDSLRQVENGTCVILGPGPGGCKVDKQELWKIGPVFAVNSAIFHGDADYCIISRKRHISRSRPLLKRVIEFGKSGGYVIAPKGVGVDQFDGAKKYGGFCLFASGASIKAKGHDPRQGFHTDSGSAILALQVARWMGFRSALLVGFDFELFANGKQAVGDDRPVGRGNQQAVAEILQHKRKKLEQYCRTADIDLYSPYWSKIAGTSTADVSPQELKLPEIKKYWEGQPLPEHKIIRPRKPASYIGGKLSKKQRRERVERVNDEQKRVALFGPNRECAVQHAFDGIRIGLQKNGVEVVAFDGDQGLTGREDQLGNFDAAFFCPQTRYQKFDMEHPTQEVFDSIHASGCATVMVLADEPYETGWYDAVAARATLRLTNEKNCVSRFPNTIYYPLTANSEKHKKLQVGKEYASDVCFIGGMDPTGFKRRIEYFTELREFLDKPGTTLIGWDFRRLGYEHAKIIPGRIPNEEAIKYYCGAKININIHRDDCTVQKSRFNKTDHVGSHVNPRCFELVACRAFQLVDNTRAELKRWFPDMPVFDCPKALKVLIERYLPDNEERRRLIQRQRPKFHENILEETLPKVWEMCSDLLQGSVSVVAGPIRDAQQANMIAATVPHDIQELVLVVEEGTDIGHDLFPRLKRVEVPVGCRKGVAWNDGFQATRGKYVLFCPGDVRLDRGGVRALRDKLRDNKDVAFAYGHHVLANRVVFTTEMDPEWTMRLNHIGEVFLVKSGCFVEFENVARFAEWQWVKSMIDAGEVGRMINEIVYVADRPMDSDADKAEFEICHNQMRRRNSGVPKIKFA